MNDDIKISNKLLDDMVGLVFNNREQISIFHNYPSKKLGTKNQLKSLINSSLKCGAFDYFYDGNKLKAYLIFARVDMVTGLSATFGIVNCIGDKKSKDWIIKKLEELQFLFNDSSQIILPYPLKKLIPAFNKLGFNIDTVRLMGAPKDCLKKLNFEENPVGYFNDRKLQLSTATKLDLQEVKEIERKEFRRNPQYGWFVSNECWLSHMYFKRLKSLKNDDIKCYVLKSIKGKVKGYFGFFIVDDPNYGKVAGPELIFDNSIQGKGLSKVAYHILLQDMVKMKVKFIQGNTSQIGVMKNAKKMGRVPVSFFLRYHEGYFDQNHFFRYI